MAWVAIADSNDIEAAKSAAQWMAKRAWELRELLCAPPGLSTADAVQQADQLYVGPKPPGENDASKFIPPGPEHAMNFVPQNGRSLEESPESSIHCVFLIIWPLFCHFFTKTRCTLKDFG